MSRCRGASCYSRLWRPISSMNNSFTLDGETALITGGGTGLGLGMARCFSQAGAKVVLVGRREAELRRATDEIGPAARYVAHDIIEVDRAAQLLKRAQEIIDSPVTILVNNAGIHLKKSAVETAPAEFSAVFQTHVLAAHALTS